MFYISTVLKRKQDDNKKLDQKLYQKLITTSDIKNDNIKNKTLNSILKNDETSWKNNSKNKNYEKDDSIHAKNDNIQNWFS